MLSFSIQLKAGSPYQEGGLISWAIFAVVDLNVL
jgi:hypothetical protein